MPDDIDVWEGCIWEGCNSSMALAVEAFASQWEPYSTTSRRYSLYSLVERILDPEWGRYIDALPEIHPGRTLCQGRMPGRLAREHGFWELGDWFKSTVHAYLGLCETNSSDHDAEFLATLDTMLDLADLCASKKPKHQPVGNIKQVNRVNGRLARKFCAFCGQPSELEAFRIDQSRWPEEPGDNRRLSSRYCQEHRTVRQDGGFNTAYKRAARNRMKFKRELDRLQRQSWSVVAPRANTGSAAADLFVLNLIGRDAIYPDERGKLRDLANRLVESKLSDRKKEIVCMLASGMKAACIARQLGVSRQAVSKTLKSIPAEFRFDLASGKVTAEGPAGTNGEQEASHALDPILKAALENPEIHEIYVNPDARLWAEYTDSPAKCIGLMEIRQVSRLIAWIAQCAGKQVDPEHPIMEADFPGYSARFMGIVPPVVKQAIFSIRKKTDPNGWQGR
ncbi:hypothetical protein [Massilia sp. GCM10023247]|uniref:hypothetical protein n=1 Tax=Massilia sp. GCM10023247 TaxID=3252643 RepID=UPI003616FA10